MDYLVTLDDDRRRVLCEKAGHCLGLSAGSVERDLWVCWMLRLLFSLPQAGPHLTFKRAGYRDHHSAGTATGHEWPHESVARGDRWYRSVSRSLAVPAAL